MAKTLNDLCRETEHNWQRCLIKALLSGESILGTEMQEMGMDGEWFWVGNSVDSPCLTTEAAEWSAYRFLEDLAYDGVIRASYDFSAGWTNAEFSILPLADNTDMQK